MTDTYVFDTYTIDPATRDISAEVLDADGRIRVLPAAYWADTSANERAMFGNRHGIYSFPTVELVDYLRQLIGERSAIEIAAGHGVLAQALGIPATDSRQQEKDYWRNIILAAGITPVPYGPNVIEVHASRAVRDFEPQVVVACYVCHRYDRNQHDAGGNMAGVDERDVLANCHTYVMVGHEHVHRNSALWALPHTIEYPPFVYSRARHPGRDFIAVWQRRDRASAPPVGRKPGR